MPVCALVKFGAALALPWLNIACEIEHDRRVLNIIDAAIMPHYLLLEELE